MRNKKGMRQEGQGASLPLQLNLNPSTNSARHWGPSSICCEFVQVNSISTYVGYHTE